MLNELSILIKKHSLRPRSSSFIHTTRISVARKRFGVEDIFNFKVILNDSREGVIAVIWRRNYSLARSVKRRLLVIPLTKVFLACRNISLPECGYGFK